MKWFLLFLGWLIVESNDSIIYRVDVRGQDDNIIGELKLSTNVEPIDAIAEFCATYGITNPDARHQLLYNACQDPQVICRRQVPLLFSSKIQGQENEDLGVLRIFESEEPADVIFRFGMEHGLAYDHRRSILASVCTSKRVKCTRESALIFSRRIHDDQKEAELRIFEHEEPVDAIHQFMIQNKFDLSVRNTLLQSVCQELTCQRTQPVVFYETIQGPEGENLGKLAIFEGQEAADIIYNFGKDRGLDKSLRYVLMDNVCKADGVTCNRIDPIVFSSMIHGENGEELGVLSVHEDEETVDAIYKFNLGKNMTETERFTLLQRVCQLGKSKCTRGRAVLYQTRISDDNGEPLGQLTIQEGEEPADAVYRFGQTHKLTREMWQNLIHQICHNSVNCTREAPIIYSVGISDENGTFVEQLNIQDGQEPVDAVAPFCKKHDYTEEQRKNLLQSICEASGLWCTRDKAVYLSKTVPKPNGEVLGTFHIMEDQEPADVIYDFGLAHGLTFHERRILLFNTCLESKNRFNCTRAEARLIHFPIMETPEKELDKLEILEGQEPIDVVYRFLEKNDLFQNPLNTSLIEIVCNSTRVNCTRSEPRRVLFSLQATWYGVTHTISYVKPQQDWICSNHYGGKKCVHYVELFSKEYCEKNMPDWGNCEEMILGALRDQLNRYEDEVWKGKDLYARLGLLRYATTDEIDAAYNTLVLRINNETEPKKYEKLQDAYRVLSDPEEKYYYDLPCMKFFGLCGKKKKDGSISISMDN